MLFVLEAQDWKQDAAAIAYLHCMRLATLSNMEAAGIKGI
jgi:hypothetical protein